MLACHVIASRFNWFLRKMHQTISIQGQWWELFSSMFPRLQMALLCACAFLLLFTVLLHFSTESQSDKSSIRYDRQALSACQQISLTSIQEVAQLTAVNLTISAKHIQMPYYTICSVMNIIPGKPIVLQTISTCM